MASSLSGLNTSPSGKFTPTQIGRHKPSNSNSITQSASQPTLVLSNPELNMDIFDSKYLAETQKLIPEMDILGQSKIRDTWSAIKQKRMEMLETVLAKISHPVLGIQQKKKMLSISKYTMSFAGSDIFDWLVANCRFLVKEEALKFAQELMDCGYLISTEHVEKFDAYASQYVIQHPAFWPTRGGLPNDYDYTVNLLKRGLRNNIRDILKFYEEERLDILRKSYHTVWYEMEGKALFELKHEKGMKAGDRRMFRVQEAAFWRLHRSATPGVPKMFSDESKDAEHKTDRYTETEYCDSLTEKEQLKFLERKLEQLQVSVTQNRLKISETCKSIVHRCNIFKAVDAMLSACSNPWIQDDPLLWDVVRTTPRRCDVVLWCYSLENLLNDPLGLKYFNDFLAKEFSQENLHFYLKCRGMGEAASNKEFSDRAILTYLQFIKVGSPNELNINSNTRLAISAIFEPKDSPPPTKIPFDCFDDACEHVFALMAKDSYSRFCNSDTIQALLENSPVI
ncbi:hypothetical protein QVD99_002158 [Batrachochytrium dendrobatidis]|nr:hypothetical protein QVD99_002158 [Batrachochytrium dendrobatidis]